MFFQLQEIYFSSAYIFNLWALSLYYTFVILVYVYVYIYIYKYFKLEKIKLNIYYFKFHVSNHIYIYGSTPYTSRIQAWVKFVIENVNKIILRSVKLNTSTIFALLYINIFYVNIWIFSVYIYILNRWKEGCCG